MSPNFERMNRVSRDTARPTSLGRPRHGRSVAAHLCAMRNGLENLRT